MCILATTCSLETRCESSELLGVCVVLVITQAVQQGMHKSNKGMDEIKPNKFNMPLQFSHCQNTTPTPPATTTTTLTNKSQSTMPKASTVTSSSVLLMTYLNNDLLHGRRACDPSELLSLWVVDHQTWPQTQAVQRVHMKSTRVKSRKELVLCTSGETTHATVSAPQ